MLHALVLAAQALPVGNRAEDAGAEQAVALRFEGAVVDGLRLGDLAVRPAPDFFRRRQTDADGIEIRNHICHFKWARTKQGVPPLPALYSSTQYRVPGTEPPTAVHVSRNRELPIRETFSQILKFVSVPVRIPRPRCSVPGTRD